MYWLYSHALEGEGGGGADLQRVGRRWGGQGRARGILAVGVGPSLGVAGEGVINGLVLGPQVLEGVASCPSCLSGEGVGSADLKGWSGAGAAGDGPRG